MDEGTSKNLIRFGLIAYALMVLFLFVAVGLGVELWSQHQESGCEQQYPGLVGECRDLYSTTNHIVGGLAFFQQ